MTIISTEIERFDRLSETWWNRHGPMRPLHVVNALRLDYVIAQVASHIGRNPASALYGLRVLDVGCGGGLLSEPMARHGAIVVGVDASPGNISAAQRHAALHGVEVEYRLGEPADVVLPEEKFDLVMALEVVEHVSDMPAFLATAAATGRVPVLSLQTATRWKWWCSGSPRALTRQQRAGAAVGWEPPLASGTSCAALPLALCCA